MKTLGVFIAIAHLFLWPAFSFSQLSGSVIRLPAHKVFPMRDSIGKVLWTKITNTSNFPDTLYPLYDGKPGTENKYRNDRSLINWLIAQVPDPVLNSGNADDIHMALIRASATLTKGDTKLSTINFFNESKCDNPDSAFVRKYSIIGSQMAAYHDHCGEQARFQQELLVATGYFTYADLFTVVLGWHTTSAFLYKGDTVAVDLSNNHQFFLIKNPARHSGYASPQDLHNDTMLITASQGWRYVKDNGDTVNAPLRAGAVSQYRQTYAYIKPRLKKTEHSTNATYKIENMWVMPPHSSVMWADTLYYVIDSSGSEAINNILNTSIQKAAAYSKLRIMTRKEVYGDSINQVIMNSVAQITGTDINTARDIFLKDRLALYSPSPGWQPSKVMTVPQLHISVVADTSFILFGRDAYFGAGLITRQHLKNKYTDTWINYSLWNNKLEGAQTVRSYKEVIYPISREIFVPPGSTLDLDISYNPGIIDFYHGPSFRVSNPDALLIEASGDAFQARGTK